MRPGLPWLAIVDLRTTWLRSTVAVLAIALALIAVSFFSREARLREAKLLAGYEEVGATTLIVDLGKLPANDIESLAQSIRSLAGVNSVEAPYNGTHIGLVADTSFVVFENERQQESLGAQTAAVGVDRSFDPARDYYVNFHDLNVDAPQSVLGAPLMAISGDVRAPDHNEVLLSSGVTDYVGVRPGAEATVDLMYAGVNPPIVRRFEGLRLIGTFELVGPDEGRFEPFWRFAARGHEVLTVRRPDFVSGLATTLPVLLSDTLVREFLADVSAELKARGASPNKPLEADQLIVRARTLNAVPTVLPALMSLLEQRGLAEDCNKTDRASYCLRLPEQNNFGAALEQQSKLTTGASFFISLLVLLVAIGTAGLQLQFVLSRWREFGIMQAIGFSPVQIIFYCAIRLYALFAASAGIAIIVVLATPFLRPVADLLATIAVLLVVGAIVALPALLWPFARQPAELLRISM